MTHPVKPLIVAATALAALPQPGVGQAAAPDFEIARQAVARGDILPLAEVLSRLDAIHPGRVVEVELEEEDGRQVYEIELVTAEGRLIEVEIDAATGVLLALEEEDDDDDDDDESE